MKKKILAAVMAATMVFSLVACGSSDAGSSAATGSAATDTASAGATSTDASGDLIKVGIINNDPNESGYRTANDKDMKNTFTEANGYEASFAYSLKNDEQITAAQKFIQDGVDYLLLSAADTAGWDSVLKDAQDAGIRVILFDRTFCTHRLHLLSPAKNERSFPASHSILLPIISPQWRCDSFSLLPVLLLSSERRVSECHV